MSGQNLKGVSYVLPESGTFIISQSSRDQKTGGANIKNMHLRKYIESKEREKRQQDTSKVQGTNTSASRTSGVRYINDLVAKSPTKSGKLGNNRKAQQ